MDIVQILYQLSTLKPKFYAELFETIPWVGSSEFLRKMKQLKFNCGRSLSVQIKGTPIKKRQTDTNQDTLIDLILFEYIYLIDRSLMNQHMKGKNHTFFCRE